MGGGVVVVARALPISYARFFFFFVDRPPPPCPVPGTTAASLFGQGTTYTYDDIIFMPGFIDFGAHEVRTQGGEGGAGALSLV